MVLAEGLTVANEVEKQKLAEKHATRISCRYEAVQNGRVLVRYWPDIDDSIRQSALQYLNTYGSVLNDSAPSQIVVNPLVDQKTYTGTWRVMSNEDGRYRQQSEFSSGIVQTLVELGNGANFSYVSLRSCMSDEYTYSAPSQVYPIACPDDGPGYTYSASSALNPQTGLYEGTLQYKVLVPKWWRTVSQISQSQREVQVSYRNWPVQIEAHEAGIGGVYRASSSLGDGCVYNGELSYVYSDGRGIFWFKELNIAPLERRDALVYNDWPTQINAPDSPVGAVYDASSSLNSNGLYDGRLGYRRLKPFLMYYDDRGSAGSRRSRISYRSLAAPLLVPAVVANGGTYSASFSFEDGQVYNGDLIYDPGNLYQHFTFRRLRTISEEETETNYKRSPVMIEVPAGDFDAGVYSVSMQVDEDGLYSGPAVYQAARSVEDHYAFPLASGLYTYVWNGTDVTYDRIVALRNVVFASPYATAGGVPLWNPSISQQRSRRFPKLYDYTIALSPFLGRVSDVGDAWTTGHIYQGFTNDSGKNVYVYKKMTSSIQIAADFQAGWRTTPAPVYGHVVVGTDSGHYTDVQIGSRGRLIAITVMRQS